MPNPIKRAGLLFAAVVVITLIGGVWIASAQGTIPAPPATGPSCGIGAAPLSTDPTTGSIEQTTLDAFAEFGACGIFAVCNTGYYTINLSDYLADCGQTDLTSYDVMCVGPNGDVTTWTVPDIVLSNGKLEFTVVQDGHCILTTAKAPVSAATGYVKPGVISG